MLRAVVTDEIQHVLPHGDGWLLRAAPPCATPEGFVARRTEVRDRMSHRGYEVGAWPLFDIEVSAQHNGPELCTSASTHW